ncbi:breast cancer type 2 susceptibility protein [Falco biarmicus]|uniref:breast cancer type 2 susceptibility protein n=1 Tax=Falco biarmicus TaxID=345155 RepID=UPI0024BCA966|nr:breast cancer type 2 susceptibility protein [Falco biarmicus]XP_056184671.1 breast cancer type 2 susceptibility protein [Falco biarmicus]
MACKPVERPTFFEIFKARCSESDLGPISLNWFEELSAEAPPYEPKLLGELDGPFGWLDPTSFKTPRAKPTYSQLASTPLIFKERNIILPPYSSPGKELDQKKTGASKENLLSPDITRRKIDQENEIDQEKSPGTCCNCLAASPAIVRNTYRTPQRNNMPGPYGSLFCTPKLLEVRTPKCISESLGAEVDPDMSWSSSLATPPTLGATVIIARENDSISGAKQQDERADIILHNFFSKYDKYPGVSDKSMLSVPETVKPNAEDDVKDFESEMLDGLFGEMNSFEDTFNMPAKSNGTLLLMPHGLDAVEKCEMNTDKAQGKGDVPSEQPNRRKTGISQEMKTTNWTEKSHSIEVKDSLLRNTGEDPWDGKAACLIGQEKESESLMITGYVHYRTHKSSENEKPVKEDVQSSSQWSQLNLSDLDVTHLEMSVCSSSPSDLRREKNLEEKSVLITEDDTLETSLLNTSDLIKAQKLLSINLSEKCYEIKNSENNPKLEVTPVNSVCLSVRDPKLAKGCAAEKVSKMSFLNCNSFLIESTNVMEYSIVYNGSFSTHLKAISKSVITDVVSHPVVCGATSPDNCNDLHLINRENTPTKSGFKSLNMLSSLRKRSKRLIYTINNTLLYQEEKIQKEVTSELPIHPVLMHSESDLCEFKGCRVASVDKQDCLLLAERKCLQSNIKKNNFSTCTSKTDVMGSAWDNSFNDRLKQQDQRGLEGNTREDQPATSLKCVEVSNTQKEDTTTLKSKIIPNTKSKALTSACLMARKCSRLLPKGCCLEKGEEDEYVSANMNNGDTVLQSPKEELVWSSPRDNEHLIDVHRDTISVTNSSCSNTQSQINFCINGVSSDCCSKIPTGRRHATDWRSVVDGREACEPLGINYSENCSIGLRQSEKTDAAAWSEVVANNEEPKSAENKESPQAAAFNNVAVESAKELLDCIDNNSLNEVISEEDKQFVPMYSSKNPNENLKNKGKSPGNLNACSLNLGFGGFQTASNKQIKFSEFSIAKGRMLFKDIENECFEACSMQRVGNFSNKVKKANMFFSDSESKLGGNLSDSLDSQTSFLNPRLTQFIPHKVGLCKSFPRSPQSLQETNQTLTASQEAEIAELSSILEETGSQFEFTQFRKQSNVQSHAFQQFGTLETCGTKNVENIFEKRKDADFCSTFKSENQVKNDKYCTKQEDTNEDLKVVEYEKENAVVLHKNDKHVTFTKLDRNKSRISNKSFPIAKQDCFSNFVGFTSAGGKKINISKAALNRSTELFRDLEDDDDLFKSSETSTRCHNSNGHMSSNCNSVRCLTKENKQKTVCVSDFKSIDAISHNTQEKNDENTTTPFKENTENQTKRSINDTENVHFNSTNAIINSLSSVKKHNQNLKTFKQFLNQGDGQVEGRLQEDSLGVACLGDAVTTAEEHNLSISDTVENLSPNEKGEDRKEDERLSQKFQTPAGGDISSSDAALDHSLHLLNIQYGGRDVNVLDNSDKQKINCESMEDDTTHDKKLLLNESRIKIGSYHHHHQIPFEQEVNFEKNQVKGSYLTGFHTASGKKIIIADGFLAKAEQFFAEDVDVGREYNDNFENLIKKRKHGKNCIKDSDLCIEGIARCDLEKPGDQFKLAVESSPVKHTVVLDPVEVDTSVNLGEGCERSLVTSYAHKKADVRPGESEFESLTRQESDTLSRAHLPKDGKLFAERKMEYSPEKSDDSENIRDFPVHSAASLHLMKVSDNLEDNSVPGDKKNTFFVEYSNNRSNRSFLLNSKSSSVNCDSKKFDLECLNEPCGDRDCFADTMVNACQNQSRVSLPEDENNLARLKETTSSVENQEGNLKQTVFSTAKGKAVSVSEGALARVRQMFQDDYSESVKYEIETNSRTEQTEVAGNSFVIHTECPNSAKFFNATRSEASNSAASHFIKVNVSVSENGHQDTNTFADAKSVSNSQKRCFEQNIETSGHLPVPDKQIKLTDSSVSSLGFFSTASGKPVQLSEESLRKARQLFSEMEGNHSAHVQEDFLIEENIEKSEMCTEVVPRKMQIGLPKGEENASTELISYPAFGFSTASGKQVTVSKNAYQKAKAILKESDDFVSSGLCIRDQLSSVKESGQCIKSLTDKVNLESKVEKSCNEDLELKNFHPEEMKSFASTHHVRMPEYISHSKKTKQLSSLKNSFQQEETRPFGKGQLNLGMKTESEAISCRATAKGETNLLQTPKNYFVVEAEESARAFMEDDFSDSGVQTNAARTFSSRLDKNFQMKTLGKRHYEEENSLGGPPIKRQLLLEFNRTKNPPRSLKPSVSTPDGIFRDRRKFMYHVPLKPITCQPFGATKERQEVKNPNLTLPDQDFKGLKSKHTIFQHCALRQSSNATSGFSTPCKASAKEGEETRSLYKSGKTAKTFIPPFKTKLTFSTGEQGSSKRCDSLISKNLTEKTELGRITTEQNIAEPQDHQSYIQHIADTDLENGKSATVKMMTNLRFARDLQDMRIQKKYRQNISSQPGTLYVMKTSARNRISLKTAVEEKSPRFYSMEELYTYGVTKNCIQVNSTNAESFQFLIKDFFSKEYLLAGNGMQLADGGWLIPTDDGKAGKKEFYRALCDTPGVDPNLITEAWVYNHYRWIVWKLAAMEVSFPHEFANRCLTPETVLLQLKYRYDLEVDKSKRSAIKKIMERDDAAGKTLILCISKIISLNTVACPSSSNKNVESKRAAAIIEVTDGWYGIRALLDPPLKAFLHRRRLSVGQKIIVHGAELVGFQNGCTPLEAPDSLMLKISANSTRCARWHAKLGFHRDPRPFPLPLSSLYSEGGAVGCIDVVIQRTYPIQWMEKTSAGSYVFRNSRAEEREAAKHAEDQQKKLEALFAKIQAEYEKHEERTSRITPRSRIVTRQQIRNLQDGAELFEAIQNASDPGYMEGYLSEDQLKTLNAYRQLMNDKKQTQIQEEFKKALESAEQEENGGSKRDVSAVWKLCVVDYRKQEKHKGVILTIWRPLLDVCSLLKEGSRYRIYQLSTSQSKGRSDSANIQLSATKKTQYLQLPVSQEMLLQVFFPRNALKFTSLSDPSFQPPCAEVDLVGVVVSVSRTGFTTMVYLSDESYNLVAVKIRTDLRHFAIEDLVVRCSFLSVSNLQWQSEFRSEIPVLVAGELSVFSASPKENYLQEKVNELRSTIENVASFCSDAESKMMNLLQRNVSLTQSLTKRCDLERPSPSRNSGLYAENKSLISSKIEIKHQSPLSARTSNMKLVTQGSAKTPSVTTNEDHPKTSKKRKAMDFLSCIPAPPPLTPMCSIISPSLKKAFQPPRSLGLQHSKSSKETNQNVGHVTPCRKLRETVHLPENDLVADEELAMINTQALMNNLPEEKKIAYVNENSNTIVPDLSDDPSPHNSSTGEANNSAISRTEVAENLQKNKKECEDSLPAHRTLQRQNLRKRY